MKRSLVPTLAIILSLISAVVASGVEKSALLTVEGRVASVETHLGEGDLELVEVRLSLDGDPDRIVGILLGPQSAMAEIGFSVEEGDRLRAKIFRDDEEPAKAHKALNLSRDSMVRFRTLRRVPLWDSSGVWQGGPGRGPGAGGSRAHGSGKGGHQGGGGQGAGSTAGQGGPGGGPR